MRHRLACSMMCLVRAVLWQDAVTSALYTCRGCPLTQVHACTIRSATMWWDASTCLALIDGHSPTHVHAQTKDIRESNSCQPPNYHRAKCDPRYARGVVTPQACISVMWSSALALAAAHHHGRSPLVTATPCPRSRPPRPVPPSPALALQQPAGQMYHRSAAACMRQECARHSN